nr:PDZ domain-containing protein 8-like [Pongo abelii]
MGLLLTILASAVLSSFLTLLAQFLLLYRRQPEPPADEAARLGRRDPHRRPRDPRPADVGDLLLPQRHHPIPVPGVAGHRADPPLGHQEEFEKLLQTKTAGSLLEGLSLRDVFLGETVPFIETIRLVRTLVPSATGEPDGPEGEALPAACPEELAFEAEVEYKGGFHLAIHVDLVLGKSAYLFVKLSRVVGRLRLVFTRVPFTHWFFSFVEDPLMDFKVRSQFEGRPMPQLTSIIFNQLKKIIKRKHILPNYKIRFKPFFPYQTLQGFEEGEEHIHIQQRALTEGRLKVTLLECSRLLIFGSYDREANVHCTLELSISVWDLKISQAW